MLVEVEAEDASQCRKVGQGLPRTINGQQAFAFPASMVGETLLEILSGPRKEVLKEDWFDGAAPLAEGRLGDELLGLPSKEASQFDGQGLAG